MFCSTSNSATEHNLIINNSKICCKMSKKHDENKDLRLISRIAKVDYADKTIQASKSAIIGNRSWGRIDYLTHYCGWTFIWNNSVHVSGRYTTNDTDNLKRKRDAKTTAKETTFCKYFFYFKRISFRNNNKYRFITIGKIVITNSSTIR